VDNFSVTIYPINPYDIPVPGNLKHYGNFRDFSRWNGGRRPIPSGVCINKPWSL